MKKQVLYLSYDGLTDPLGQSQVLPYLTKLSDEFRITIVSFEKKEPRQKNEERIKDICKQANIRWMPLSYTKKPPVLSTLKDIRLLRKLVYELIQKEDICIVHCRSYLTSLVGLSAKRKFGTKFIFDMRGFWADERVDGNLWSLKNPLYKTIYSFFKRKEKEFFTEADQTVSLTLNARNEIENMVSAKAFAPIAVIPCCVDLKHFDYARVSEDDIAGQKKKLKIAENAIVVSYTGSIGTWYMPREMVSFFKIWLSENPNSVFLFITKDDPLMVKKLCEDGGVDSNIIRIVQGERPQMPLLIACSDYSLFFIKPVFSKKASSPTKQGEIMAMGKPIICNAFIGDTDYVINRYEAGVVIEKFTEDEYKQKIKEFREKSFHADKIRTGANEFYSLENGVKTYRSIYRRLLGNSFGVRETAQQIKE